MSISTALSNAVSGLTVSSRTAELISDNVANALTPGYLRKSLDIESRVVAGAGHGARVAGVVAAQDPVLTAERRRVESSSSEAQTELDTLDRITRALGTPGQTNALAERAAALETALAASTGDPSSVQKQSNLLEAAKGLTNTINQISTENRRIRMDSDAEISKQVGEVNAALSQIQTLNQEISLRTISGGDASALIDQRQKLIDRVSKIIPIRTARREDGAVALFSPQSQVLLDGPSVASLGFTSTGLITSDMTIGSGALSGLTVDGQAVTIGQGGGKLDGGSLSALFEARDVTVPGFDGQLDALAEDLINRFQDPAVDTSLAVGDAGLFTDNGAAVSATPTAGLAGRIAVNAAADPSAGGDLWRLRDGMNAAAPGVSGASSILENMLDAAQSQQAPDPALGIVRNMSFAGFAAEVTAQQANAAERADERFVNLSAQGDSLREAEAAATGVDTDEELQKLLLVEQAYAANARVISVVDNLLQRLMEL